MISKARIGFFAFFLAFQTPALIGSDCSNCHASKGVREKPPNVEPIVIQTDGKIRKISLADAFRFHQHSCPGMTAAYRAIQYGFLLLFGKEIPEQKDVAVISRTPVDGVLDMFDLLMIGENRAERTHAPAGMKGSRDAFYFTLVRKSTSTAVDIHLKPELYPKDFFEYKKKQADKKLTPEEWQVLHGYMKDMILKFPILSFEDLFGKPQPYKTILWGAMMPAHNRPPASGGNE